MAELTEQKQQAKAMWAMGDYPSAAEQIAEVGPRAVEAAAVSAEDSVLDVACGAGNATIPALRCGALGGGQRRECLGPNSRSGRHAACAEDDRAAGSSASEPGELGAAYAWREG